MQVCWLNPQYFPSLIFGAKDGYLYKINAKTGDLVWKFFAKAEILSDLSIDSDAIYFLSGANILYKIDAESGKQKWVYSRVQRSRFSVRGGAQVLVLGPRIYAGFSDGFLVALQSESGDLVWERKLASSERFGDVDNSPLSNGELIFSASFDGNFLLFFIISSKISENVISPSAITAISILLSFKTSICDAVG